MEKKQRPNIKKLTEFSIKKMPFIVELYIIMILFLVIPLVIVTSFNTNKLVEYSEKEIGKYANDSLNSLVLTNQIMTGNLQTAVIKMSKSKYITDIKDITSYESLNTSLDNTNLALKVLSLLKDQLYSETMIQSVYIHLENADYIITTNYGIVSLDACRDTDAIEEVTINNKNKENRWMPRTIPSSLKTNDASGKSENVISYIYNLSNLTTTVKGTIVLNLYEYRVNNFINNSEFDANSDTSIIDNSGIVVSNKDTTKFKENLSTTPYVQKILKVKSKKGYISYGDKLYTYSKDSYMNWIYIRQHDMKQLMEKAYEVRKSGTIMTVIITIIATFISFLLAQRLSMPLNRLVKNLKSKEGIEVDTSRNEWYILEKAFQQISEQELNLKEIVKTSENDVRKQYLTQVLSGNNIGDYNSIDTSVFPYENFMVIILSFDRNKEFLSNYSSEQRYYIRALLLSKCEKMQIEDGVLHGIISENKAITLIVNTKAYDWVATPLYLRNKLMAIQNEMGEVTDNTFSAGISGCHHSLKGIAKSVQEADEALKRKIVMESKSIIIWNPNMSDTSNFYYPYQIERHILNYLSSNNQERVIDEIKILIQEIKNRKDISPSNIYQIFNQLIGASVKYIMENHSNTNEIFGDMNYIYSQVSAQDTLDEIENFMVDFYRKINDYFLENKDESSNNYSDKIIDYIRTNYKKEINFEEMAENIGISYSYARKIMKDTTDTSLSDYLNKVRIEESKKLIHQTNTTFSEIAVMVGYNNIQSFTRYFKKYEGITLSEYKAKSDIENEISKRHTEEK